MCTRQVFESICEHFSYASVNVFKYIFHIHSNKIFVLNSRFHFFKLILFNLQVFLSKSRIFVCLFQDILPSKVVFPSFSDIIFINLSKTALVVASSRQTTIQSPNRFRRFGLDKPSGRYVDF